MAPPNKIMKQILSAILLAAVIFPTAGCSINTALNTDNVSTGVKSTTPVVTPPSTGKVSPPVFNTTTVPVPAPSGTYKNVDGNLIPSPYAAPSAPIGASARCRDGTYSFSQHRSGTCSHHGGVAEWL